VQLKKSGLVGILARTSACGNALAQKIFTRFFFYRCDHLFGKAMNLLFVARVVQLCLIMLALHACGAISRCATSSIVARNLNATVFRLAGTH
jgi:hypothetical protein